MLRQMRIHEEGTANDISTIFFIFTSRANKCRD